MNKPLIAALAASFVLAGCGANGTSPLAPQQQVNVASNVLQVATGTANLYGAATALNVVATYRQPAGGFRPGASGTLLNSPTLTVPNTVPPVAGAPASYDPTSTVLLGPSAIEIGGASATSSSQAFGPLDSRETITSFGQSGGVFGSGIEPFNATGPLNATGATTIGTPFQVAPYPVPLYDSSSPTFAGGADPNKFIPWGGPPAYDILGNGQSAVGNASVPGGSAGIPLGIDVFAGIAPVAAGKYTLSATVPVNTGTTTATASFTLPGALTVLGNAIAPAYTPDGNGGGTFAFVMPAGATDAIIEVVDANGTCNGSTLGRPYYYTIHATASGVVTLPDGAAPGGKPSICTAAQNAGAGDEFTAQVIAFDYPFFAASYPSSLGNPTPALTTGSSADLTISPTVCRQEPAGGGAFGPCADTTPLSHRRF
ncbi:MAG: hypothetical protein NVS9B12_09530 [Vulcanimicrobiaceae bacterium]